MAMWCFFLNGCARIFVRDEEAPEAIAIATSLSMCVLYNKCCAFSCLRTRMHTLQLFRMDECFPRYVFVVIYIFVASAQGFVVTYRVLLRPSDKDKFAILQFVFCTAWRIRGGQRRF